MNHGDSLICKSFYQNCSLKGQLCLAGYAQGYVPGKLKHFTKSKSSESYYDRVQILNKPELLLN